MAASEMLALKGCWLKVLAATIHNFIISLLLLRRDMLAFTQVLFSGRSHMQVIDIFLSMTNETNSHAAYFMLKYGLERTALIEYYNQNYREGTSKKTATGRQYTITVGGSSIADSGGVLNF